MARILDVLFFIYFFTHIPIALFIDSQAVLPQWLYPKQFVDLKAWYCREFRDPMMVDPPPWFRSFCVCGMVMQLPFCFVASYAFFKGAAKAWWIRIPVIIYSSHVATTLITIFFHTMLYDFSLSAYPAPRTMQERLTLCAIYSPDFVLSVLILLDACFSSVYREPIKAKKG